MAKIKVVNSIDIEESVSKLKTFLINTQFEQREEFLSWKNKFSQIYGKDHANIDLFLCFSYVYFLSYLLLYETFLNKSIKEIMQTKLELIIQDIEYLKNRKQILKPFFDVNFFLTFIETLNKQNLDIFEKNLFKIYVSLKNKKVNREFYYDYLFQNLIPSHIRHIIGEYYTPPFLAKNMIQYCYEFGEKVLDPSCGTGNFLIEIVKNILSSNYTKIEKIDAIKKIYGFDINPMSLFMTNINLIMIVYEHFKSINYKINLVELNTLSPDINKEINKFDLIIGNPPWYTLRDIKTKKKQETFKSLADELNIKPTPKNILNIEVSTLFFYQCNELFMKNDSKIFFVLPKGVITGSHADRFRAFIGFKDIKIWQFGSNISKFFNIDFICLYAKKSDSKIDISQIEIISDLYDIKTPNLKREDCYQNINLTKLESSILVPLQITENQDKIFVKKFIRQDTRKKLLDIKESYYKKRFHKGADLNPRNLIFVKSQLINENLTEINPDKRIFKRAKAPWNNLEFHNEIVELEYIFKAVKSTELIKFYVYNSYEVFLPLSKADLSFNYKSLSKNTKKFYDKINGIYLSLKKKSTKKNSLIENLNHWAKLINTRQLARIKVVYNNSGSLLKAAVIRGNFLITSDLSFYGTSNIDEAYYLSAILNSNLITEQIKIMKSSRHIFKKPFNLNIIKFDKNNKNHKDLVELARRGERKVKQAYQLYLNHNEGLKTKQNIEKYIYASLEDILSEIEVIVQKELT